MDDSVNILHCLIVRSGGFDDGNNDSCHFSFVFREAIDDEIDLLLSADSANWKRMRGLHSCLGNVDTRRNSRDENRVVVLDEILDYPGTDVLR